MIKTEKLYKIIEPQSFMMLDAYPLFEQMMGRKEDLHDNRVEPHQIKAGETLILVGIINDFKDFNCVKELLDDHPGTELLSDSFSVLDTNQSSQYFIFWYPKTKSLVLDVSLNNFEAIKVE